MKELIAFILPPATALAGMRVSRWVLGQNFSAQFGFGFRFAFGLALGMLIFTQGILLSALAGFNASPTLAWLAIAWGGVEIFLIVLKFPAGWKSLKFQTGHLWLLLLLPLLYSWWVFGRLSTLEGTLEFDANAFWVFKSKILFLEQGKDLVNVLHQANLGYTHLEYPMLVPCLYTFDYGVIGAVDEFVNKVWPFWMVVALCMGILSLGEILQRPRFLPIAIITFIAFLPLSLHFIRNEGGTIPMVFYISLAVLLVVNAIRGQKELAPAAVILIFAGCFATKLEGAVFAAACSCALLPFCLQRGWLKSKVVWQSAVVAAACLLPFVFYRMTKPVLTAEYSWWHDGLTAPHAVLYRFPQMWFLNIFVCFFSPKFFSWEADNNHLHWIGQWTGWDSLVNNQLSVLPWLLIALLVFSIIYNSQGRVALLVLSTIVIGLMTFLSFVAACQSENHDDLAHSISYTFGSIPRLYGPFFIAWFLGIVTVWFTNDKNSAGPKPRQEKVS
jgi:hypothetical protein